MRALGFEPKKEEIRKMIADIDKDGSGKSFASYPGILPLEEDFPDDNAPGYKARVVLRTHGSIVQCTC